LGFDESSEDERDEGESPLLRRKKKNARERLKFTLPDSCKMEMQKLNTIEKMNMDYVLVAHPYP